MPKPTYFKDPEPNSQSAESDQDTHKHEQESEPETDESVTEYLRGMLQSLIEKNSEIHDFIENMTKEEEQIMSKRVSDEMHSILKEYLQNKKAARLDKQDEDTPKDSSTTPSGP